MKYLKFNALLVALLAFNVVLWGQEPCTDLPVKPIKGEVIQLPTIIAPHTDVQSPLDFILTCPANQSINLGAGATTATVTWDDPTGITTCNFGGLTINQSQGAASGASFSEGTYTIEYQATDACGNSAVCNFTVWVGHYDPTVIFVHGLGGNKKSWLSASQWQEDKYYSQEQRLQYIESSGLESAAFDLKDNLIPSVKSKMENSGGNPSFLAERKRNFIIAHSQGGVVSQVMEKIMREQSDPNAYWSWGNRYYNGLVTFGSPHQGAYIMNSLIEDHNGNLLPSDFNCKVDPKDGRSRVGDFVHDAEKLLLPALIADNINLKGLPKLFETSISNTIEGVANALIDPIVLKYLIGAQAVNCTTRGFAIGSSDIFGTPDYQLDASGNVVVDGNGVAVNPTSRGGLNTFFEYSIPQTPLAPLDNTIPKVAFYGEINDESTQGELFWRVGFWQKNSVNTDSDGTPDGINGFGPMGANRPVLKDGQEDANKHKLTYLGLAEEYRHAADLKWNTISIPFILPSLIFNKLQAKKLYKKSTLFRQGYQWYETANAEYKTLIGVSTYVVGQNCECECIKEYFAFDDPNPPSPVIHTLNDCNSGCGQFESTGVNSDGDDWKITCSKKVKIITHTKQSDGVVLAESAANMAGATVNENTPGFTKDDFVMYGSIHMQMRNDKNLKVKLEKLYTDYYDNQFYLELK